jgi:hypothetical protein
MGAANTSKKIPKPKQLLSLVKPAQMVWRLIITFALNHYTQWIIAG